MSSGSGTASDSGTPCPGLVPQVTKGLKVAAYYGCQIVRPYSTFDDQADPQSMDQLLEALGATVIDWQRDGDKWAGRLAERCAVDLRRAQGGES